MNSLRNFHKPNRYISLNITKAKPPFVFDP